MGPKVFLTDDGTAMINAIHNTWPQSEHLLCQWHVLQALWRWIGNSNHNVKKADRPHLFRAFKKLCYSDTKEKYDEAYNELVNDAVIKKYSNYLTHLQRLYFHREQKWTKYHRLQNVLPLHGANTSNFCEASFRIFKDVTMNRVKAFNLCEFVQTILQDDSSYYKDKLVHIGNGRVSQFKTSEKYRKKYPLLEKEKITQISETVFEVESQANTEITYRVDMFADTCSCPMQGICKHKKSIAHHFEIEQFAVLPSNDAFSMCRYHYIALGRCEEPHWYRQFNKKTDLVTLKAFIDNLKTLDIDTYTENSNLTENIETDSEGAPAEVNDDDIVDENMENYDIADTSYTQEEPAENDDDNDNIPTKLNDFFEDLNIWKTKLVSNYKNDKSIQKAVSSLHTKIKKQINGNPETFKQHLFDMGSTPSIQIGKGKKKKNGSVIPVLAHSRSRRTYKQRGNRAVPADRKFKDPKVRQQMV